MGARRLTGVWALTLLALGVGCPDDPIDEEATPSQTPSPTAAPTPTAAPVETPTETPEVTPTLEPEPLRLVTTFPADGAWAVPRATDFSLFFNEPITTDVEHFAGTLIRVDTGEETDLGVPTLSEDGLSVSWAPYGLAKDVEYRFEALLEDQADQLPPPETWPLEAQARFTTEVPCGMAWNIVTGVSIEQLGGNPAIVGVLNDTLAASSLYPVGLLFVDTLLSVTFPLDDMTVVSGLVDKSSSQPGSYEVTPEFGFPVSLNGCVVNAEGGFLCGPVDFLFPIPVTDETILNLYISNALVSAQLAPVDNDQNGQPEWFSMGDFRLEGVITEEDIERIGEETGLSRVLDTILELDQDLDGDGVMDAATAVAVSQPSWIAMAGCSL